MTDTGDRRPTRASWSAHVLLAALGLFLSPVTVLLAGLLSETLGLVMAIAAVPHVLIGVAVGRRLPPALPARFGPVLSAVVLGFVLLGAVEGWLTMLGWVVGAYGVWLTCGAAAISQRCRSVRPSGRAPPEAPVVRVASPGGRTAFR